MESIDIDPYGKVPGFYGPGAVGGWYLTAISCIITWTLNPTHSSEDSLNADFIALLTFPIVASGDLIWKAARQPRWRDMNYHWKPQDGAAAAAPIDITAVFLVIGLFSHIVTFSRRQRKRPAVLFVAILFSLLAYAFYNLNTLASNVPSLVLLMVGAGFFVAFLASIPIKTLWKTSIGVDVLVKNYIYTVAGSLAMAIIIHPSFGLRDDWKFFRPLPR